ncbi:uncharacterized protein FIBRA_04425 [Fibroporia radiculosa]|uniref:CUE domain-containing protein n=1 Tax=Fibroporia radiculosa TaxID=599839 RepID=J4G7C6_9APHY|nr:uncharacterized protein FIBRA_04425 [Fibroporia radiculosa]CCM02333.1 predicted protein [Fibroporia radiculosa]
MAVSVSPLPPFPSSRARASLSPSQLATLNQTISECLAQTLSLPTAQCNSPATRKFLSTYVKDVAHVVLQSLIWDEDQTQSKMFSSLSQVERTIRHRAFLLAERLAADGSLDLQTLLDLGVAFGSTNATRLRALFSAAHSRASSSLLSAVQNEVIPAFSALLLEPSQGLYGLRKTAHIVLCLLRPAPAHLVRLFARSKPFMLSLARAYDRGLSSLAQSYGGIRISSLSDGQDIVLDQWERILLETKVSLVDSFHILIRILVADIAAVPSVGPGLAAQCEAAFEVIFALLEEPRSRVNLADDAGSSGIDSIPFLNQTLIADYQHAYDLSKLLADTLKRLDDPQMEILNSSLRSLETHDAHANSVGAGAGALRLLLRSSGAPPGIANRGFGSSSTAYSADAKGKSKAVARDVHPENPALDAAVAQVLDILPDQSPGYLRFVLAHSDYPFHGDAEKLLGALLEGTAPSPSEVERLMHAEVLVGPAASDPVSQEKEDFVYTRERTNIFDGEKMDLSNIRIGKKTGDANALLQDRAFIEEMKADILRRAEAIDDETDDEGVPGKKDGSKWRDATFDDLDEDPVVVKVRDGDESELDGPDVDGEDSEDEETVTKTPEVILELAYIQDPKQFERDGQTRRSKARVDLKAQTGWTDEQIEGWRIMLERNPKKDKILEKYEFRGNKTLASTQTNSESSHREGDNPRGRGGGRGRGGRGRGRGGSSRGGGQPGGSGDGSSARDRAWKDKNKASRANHGRKRGHDKKMARAGGPS